MTPDTLASFINTGITPLIKIILLLLILLYGVFAAVVARQVQLMNKVVNQVNFSATLFLIVLIHLLAVVFLFFLTLVIL